MIVMDYAAVDEQRFLAKLREDRDLCRTKEQVEQLRYSVPGIVASLSTAGQLKASVILEVE